MAVDGSDLARSYWKGYHDSMFVPLAAQGTWVRLCRGVAWKFAPVRCSP
jgi:hypothetical protein